MSKQARATRPEVKALLKDSLATDAPVRASMGFAQAKIELKLGQLSAAVAYIGPSVAN